MYLLARQLRQKSSDFRLSVDRTRNIAQEMGYKGPGAIALNAQMLGLSMISGTATAQLEAAAALLEREAQRVHEAQTRWDRKALEEERARHQEHHS
jgi:hypothetical protein